MSVLSQRRTQLLPVRSLSAAMKSVSMVQSMTTVTGMVAVCGASTRC